MTTFFWRSLFNWCRSAVLAISSNPHMTETREIANLLTRNSRYIPGPPFTKQAVVYILGRYTRSSCKGSSPNAHVDCKRKLYTLCKSYGTIAKCVFSSSATHKSEALVPMCIPVSDHWTGTRNLPATYCLSLSHDYRAFCTGDNQIHHTAFWNQSGKPSPAIELRSSPQTHSG